MENLIQSQNYTLARNLFDGLKKRTQNVSCRLNNFPAVEAITYMFRPIKDITIRSQESETPTIHHLLPLIRYFLRKIEKNRNG